MTTTATPRVGLGVMILKGDDVLFGLRQGSHEAGVWCIPGGHLEYGEEFTDCAIREVKEETGLDIANVRFGTVTNNINNKEDRHYVTVVMVADYIDGEPQLLEPNKCTEWKWFNINDLPSPMCSFNQSPFDQGFDPRIV